jgi:hypothetical protein
MTESQHLSDAISRLFTTHNSGWFIPFTDAVAGLTAEQAAKAPAPRFNSVWAVVNHINFWQDVILKQLQGIDVDADSFREGQALNLPNDPNDETGWQAACARAVTLNKELAALIASLPDDALERTMQAWGDSYAQAIHGLIAHNSYHICEIISIRHMNGDWLDWT